MIIDVEKGAILGPLSDKELALAVRADQRLAGIKVYSSDEAWKAIPD